MLRMRTAVLVSLAVIALLALPVQARPDQESAGKKIAATTCAACHGIDGISNGTQIGGITVPNLSPQKLNYLVQQLRAFKNGSRENPTMQSIASQLSDEQIHEVAEYYSGLSGGG